VKCSRSRELSVLQAGNIKMEAENLISQHESLMVDVERQKYETTRELDRGFRQQQIADELLADADAARDTARRAVAKAEDTLREANETLQTLRGSIGAGRPYSTFVWLGGVVVRALDLLTGDRRFNPYRCTVECDLGQVVHRHCSAPLKLRPYGAI